MLTDPLLREADLKEREGGGRGGVQSPRRRRKEGEEDEQMAGPFRMALCPHLHQNFPKSALTCSESSSL